MDEYTLSREQHSKMRSVLRNARKQAADDIIQLTQRKSNSVNTIMCMNSDADLKSRFEKRGHTVEIWDRDAFNLATGKGFEEAKAKLTEARPQYFWCTPPAVSVPTRTERQDALAPGDRGQSNNRRKHAARDRKLWDHAARLCMGQEGLGGSFYLDAPGSDQRWNIAYSKYSCELFGTANLRRDGYVVMDLYTRFLDCQ